MSATACGFADGFLAQVGDGPDEPVSEVPVPMPPDGPTFRMIQPEGELPGDAHITNGGEVIDIDGPRLVIGFWMGVEECYGVERVELTETGTEVTIDIHIAARDVDMACIELAEARAIVVDLSEPLGDRTVILGDTVIRG